MSTRSVDLIVIGTGSAGAGVAMRCRRAGWSVMVAESRPVGGTCALRGCDPKKVLVGAADAVAAARRLDGRGVRGEVRIDWPELMRFKRSLIDPMSDHRETALVEAGVMLRKGQARFTGPTTVAVDDEEWTARAVHIASGAEPVPLDIPGASHPTRSDAFLELDDLPRRIAFVGGGFISFEFAHVAAAGIAWDRRQGVLVTKHLQSVSNPAVCAAGDAAATGGPALTPVAGYEARIVAANLLDGLHQSADYSVVPSTVFTIPPLASVGLSEEKARAGGRPVRVTHADSSGWYSSKRLGETTSAYKVISDAETGRVLGAHLLGPHAEETINLFAMAMKTSATTSDIKQMLFAYPTHASDIAYMV